METVNTIIAAVSALSVVVAVALSRKDRKQVGSELGHLVRHDRSHA